MTTYKPRTKTVEAAQFTGYDSIHALVAIIGELYVTKVTIEACNSNRTSFLEAGSGMCVQESEWLVREDGALRVLTNQEFRQKYESVGPSIMMKSFYEDMLPKHLYGPITTGNINDHDAAPYPKAR